MNSHRQSRWLNTELERSSISNRSLKLFTLSGIYSATRSLLNGLELPSVDAKIELATEFWTHVSTYFPEWQLAKERKASPAELRRDYIHAHTLAMSSLARVGNQLLIQNRRGWKTKLNKLGNAYSVARVHLYAGLLRRVAHARTIAVPVVRRR